MSNRYVEEVDPNGYKEIQELCPGHMLRQITAEEVLLHSSPEFTIVDLAAGQGDSAIPIIRGTSAKVVLVDNSPEMLSMARFNINTDPVISSVYRPALEYVEMDIFDYLQKDVPGPVVLTSSWAVHNFTEMQRAELLQSIADFLRRTNSTSFIYMDKVYKDEPEEEQRVALDRQIQLFSYLRDTKVRKEIIQHEKDDFIIRMEERSTLELLKDLGFNAYVAARIERDVVIVCTLVR